MKNNILNWITIVIIIGFSCMISFIFFNINITTNENTYQELNTHIYEIQVKIDSLEKVINTNFKEKKDTIIIQTIPQDIKIYYNK